MFRWLVSDKRIERQYVRAGTSFGCALSYVHSMGFCVGFLLYLEDWEDSERKYAERGYRTIPIHDFVLHSTFGTPLKNLGEKRNPSEEPVFHAKGLFEIYLSIIKDDQASKNSNPHQLTTR